MSDPEKVTLVLLDNGIKRAELTLPPDLLKPGMTGTFDVATGQFSYGPVRVTVSNLRHETDAS